MSEQQTSMPVAAVQMVSGVTVEQNLEQAGRWIQTAVAGGAKLIALPEYFCFMGQKDTDKLALAETAGAGPIQSFLSGQAKRHGVWLVGGTLPMKSPDEDRIYNACLVYSPDGALCARYDKIHLFSFSRGSESYDESRAIRPGDEPPQVFDLPIGRTALGICYDLRFPEFFRAQGDVHLMILPAAFTYTTGSVHWEVLLRARHREPVLCTGQCAGRPAREWTPNLGPFHADRSLGRDRQLFARGGRRGGGHGRPRADPLRARVFAGAAPSGFVMIGCCS